MKAEILKIAGVKSEKEFYKKFPTEESFIKVHGKALKKAQMGAMIQGNTSPQTNPRPINFQQLYDQNDMFITGSTQDMREQEALQLADLQAQQKMSKKGSGVIDAIGKLGSMMGDDAKNGKKLKKALFGDETLPMGKPGMGDMFGKIGKGISAGVGKAGGPMAVAQNVGDIVGGFQQMRDDKNTMKQAQQMAGVSDVAFKASMTRPEPVQREYVRPDDPGSIVQPGELYNPLGFGTNVLAARNGTEIANTFAPNTIYTDLEEAQNGFSNFKAGVTKFSNQGGFDTLSQLTNSIGNPKGQDTSGGGQIGRGAGKIVGNIFGGPVLGEALGFAGEKIGNVLDKKAEKTEAFNERTQGNIEQMALGQGAQSLQQANASYMRDGGMANPQIINQFGNHKLSQLLQPDPTMDTLRAGGHLKSYTPPSERAMYTGREQFAMGGDLETHWGGYAEPMSYNPYLPKGGETVMFRGNSHDQSDGKGRTGIGITYGDRPVEVEGEEPAIELENGSSGDTSLTVYGNLKVPKFGAEMIGAPKAAGKKFKNYVADLSKTEQKQNKLIDKAVTELDNLDVNNTYDLLKFESYKANMLGANQKLKNIADEKIKLADLQSAINDTAEEYNLVADDLAKGKVKKAQKGTNVKREEIKPINIPSSVNMAALRDAIRKRAIGEITVPQDVIDRGIVKTRPASPVTKEDELGLMTIANQILPLFRPTDAEPLNPNQLSGEMFALATNQVEPVQAQTFQPQLTAPFDISLQENINQNQADYRAAQRLIGYNPAALAALNAQKYAANQKVLGEQFKLNQAMKNQVFADNRNLLNQTGVQNLGILDQQYGRQQEALSKTKATTQAALNSISAKYAQNQLENRTLQSYENLYNYRFDPRFRAMNMNPLAQFNLEGSGYSGTPFGNMTPKEIELYAKQMEVAQEKQKKMTTGKNGALVKAIKSM
jgi:hypothetical protein